MEQLELTTTQHPNGVSVRTGADFGGQLIAYVYDDESLKKTYTGNTAHEDANIYARTLIRVKGHRALRN
jgi:tRNA splicing endonuclease